MSLYRNARTGEYPRYDGDVALSPGEPWELVEENEPISEAEYGFRWVEGQLEFVDGRWMRTWLQEAISFDEEPLVEEE